MEEEDFDAEAVALLEQIHRRRADKKQKSTATLENLQDIGVKAAMANKADAELKAKRKAKLESITPKRQENNMTTKKTEETVEVGAHNLKTIDDLRAAFKAELEKKGEVKPDGSERDVDISVMSVTGSYKTSAKTNKEYLLISCVYRNLEYDKIDEKKTPAFLGDPANLLLDLEPGKEYTVSQVKEEGYWVWKKAVLRS